MRIKQVSVTNLFGLFNHTIPLKSEERITIVHGPNGFGKTVLLKLIDGLFKCNYSLLWRIPFDEFRVEFENGRYLVVKKQAPRSHSEKTRITIQGSEAEEKPFSLEAVESKQPILRDLIEGIAPELRRVGREEWLDQRTGQVLSWEDIFERYGESFPVNLEHRQSPKWLKDIQKEVNTHLVQTNRLLRQSSSIHHPVRVYYEQGIDTAPVAMSAVTQYARELAERIQQTLAKSGELSQSLDRTFPIRLVKQLSEGREPRLTGEKIRSELKELEEKRERLTAAGLMDKSESDVQIPDQATMDDLARIALSIYVRDGEKKLQVFDDLLERIGLLQKIINDRYSYSYKWLAIDKRQGFAVRTRDGGTLPPDALSSGEQHELVLFYELLFRVQPGSLILIDEPELSLHIAWQQVFLKDIIAITELIDIDVLIATHSADIIYDRWDLAVELEGPKE